MLKAVAVTTMFPFIGSTYIEYQLSNHSFDELRALRYKFSISENIKKLVKTKKGIIKYLIVGYREMGTNTSIYTNYIAPIVRRFYNNYAFNNRNPDVLPDSDSITNFAETVNTLFPDRPSYFVDILSWHTIQMGNYFDAKQRYELSLQPHKFNILTIVSPVGENTCLIECPICYNEEVTEACSAKMTCGHSYCVTCMENYLESKSNERKLDVLLQCGMCRKEITDIHFKDGEKAEEINKKYVKPLGRL